MRVMTMVFVLASGFSVAAFAAEKPMEKSMERSMDRSMEKSITVKMEALNNSGETGTATLTPEGNKTKVVVEISNEPAGAVQPAHIHLGTCATLNPAPKWPLESIKNGKSTTIVPVSLATITKEKTAVNVHKSAKEIQTYVSCGDIEAPK